MFKEDLVNVIGMGQKVAEVTRAWQKQIEHRRRDKEDKDAYVTSSYCIGKTRENRRVGAVHDITPLLTSQAVCQLYLREAQKLQSNWGYPM